MPLNYSFSRYGPALNPGKDLDWNTDRYVIYGLSTNGESRYFNRSTLFQVNTHTDNGGADSLLRHSQTPVRTSEFINAFNASGTVQSSDYPDKALLQIHGQSHNTAIHDYRLCLYRYTNVNFMASIGFDCHLLCIMDEASTPQWGVVPGTLN